MISLATLSDRLRALTSLTCAGITSFIGPVLPYGILCTSMIIADLVSARMLASRVRRRLEILFKAPGGHSRHPRQNLCPTAVVPWCRLRDRGSRQFIQHDAVLGRSDLLLATLVNTRERSLGKRRHLGPHIAQNTNRQDRTASRYRPLRPHSPGLHGRSDSYIQQHRNIADVASHARCDTAFSHYCP